MSKRKILFSLYFYIFTCDTMAIFKEIQQEVYFWLYRYILDNKLHILKIRKSSSHNLRNLPAYTNSYQRNQ